MLLKYVISDTSNYINNLVHVTIETDFSELYASLTEQRHTSHHI